MRIVYMKEGGLEEGQGGAVPGETVACLASLSYTQQWMMVGGTICPI